MQHLNNLDELKLRATCSLCGDTYSGTSVGSLACNFHPMATIFSALRRLPYSTRCVEHGSCEVCTRGFLAPEIASSMPAADLSLKGCTKIDHCRDLAAILHNPVVAIPTFYCHLLELRRTGSHLRPGFLCNRSSNLLLIDEPEQIGAVLQYTVPGMPMPQQVLVEQLYEQMAARFRLRRLRDSLLNAKRGFVQNSITRIKELRHPDAERKFSLYSNTRSVAEFVPFFIIARMQQDTPLKLV